MKKLLFLVLMIPFFLNSCSSDSSDKNESYEVTVEFLSNTDSPVYIKGSGINGKYINKNHRETVTLKAKSEYSFSASCEDKKTLISIKLLNSKGNLITEKSGNEWVIIRELSKE